MKIVAIAVITAALAAQMFAQQTDKPSDPIVSVELSSCWLSQYVSPFDKLVSKNAVVQSEARIWIKPNGEFGKFYLDVWHSIDNKGTANSDSGDGLEYTLGWKGELYQGLNLNVWATYFDFIPIGKELGGDQIRFYAELDKKFKVRETVSLTPFVRFEVPWGLKGYQDPTGLRVYPGIKGRWEFIPNWSLNQRANLFIDDGACGFQPGTFVDYKMSINWDVSSWLSVEPINFRIITPITKISDGRQTEKIFGAGISVRF